MEKKVNGAGGPADQEGAARAARKKRRHMVFAAITMAMSLAFVAAALEAALRIKFPEEMAPQDYTYNHAVKYAENGRGPYNGEPKKPGVTRIMIQGDSITWGAAVADWKDLYPYKLLSILNKDGEKYDMQVWAIPGMQMDFHGKNLAFAGKEAAPDVIVYQWYVNDVEVWADRPGGPAPFWRVGRVHRFMEKKSFLYRLLDARLGAALYKEGEKYAAYLVERITPGRKYWWYFEMEFHKWAVRANALAPRTIVMMYPSLPYKGENPFGPVKKAVLALLKPHDLRAPAAYLMGHGGKDEPGLGSTYELARVARKGTTPPGHIVYGPYINFARGDHEAGFVLKLLSPATAGAAVARLEVACAQGKKILASREVRAEDFTQANRWEKIRLPFRVDEEMETDVEFRVEYLGEADLAVDTVDVPVDYRLELVDPEERLKTFNTHARLFDAHPSPQAHTVVAEALAERIEKGPAQ